MDSNQIIALTWLPSLSAQSAMPAALSHGQCTRRAPSGCIVAGQSAREECGLRQGGGDGQRRKQIADSIKDLDKKATKRKLTLEARMLQRG